MSPVNTMWKWSGLEDMVLSQISQTEEDKYCDLAYVKREKKLIETENRLVAVRGTAGDEGLGEGGQEVQTPGLRWLRPGTECAAWWLVNNTVL